MAAHKHFAFVPPSLFLGKYSSIFPHHNLVHLTDRFGATVIEPSGNDGAESIDEKRGFVIISKLIT